MSSSLTQPEAKITEIREEDFSAWSKLFKTYVVDFYKSSIPESQYRKTFDRLIDPSKDLYGLILREETESGEGGKVLGFAHSFPHQTPWSEKMIMHLNDLYTDPSVRGKGYGKKLIEAAADDAKAKGCFRLEWATQHANPARKLYDQIGTCDFVEYRVKFGDF